MYIGFELVTQRSWTILPNTSFSIAVVWDNKKIPSSIGKDVYYIDGLVLPDKILTGTGRMNHLAKNTINYFETLQAPSCRLIKAPSIPPTALQVEIALPKAELAHTIYETTLLILWTHKDLSSEKKKAIIFSEPSSVQSIHDEVIQIDVSHVINKSFKQV